VKVSAIIPAYNAALYVMRAVESCLHLSEVIEAIIINDGSTDITIEVLSVINDPRLKIISHPDGKNYGRSASRNLGINQAVGDWILFCDADDFCLPNRLTHLIARDHAGIDGYYDLIEARTDDPNLKSNDLLKHRGLVENVAAKDLFDHLASHRESWFNLTGLTVRKSAIEKLGGFDESLVIAEDTDLIWRLARNTHLVSGESQNPVAVRWIHAGNSYHNERALVSGRYAFYKKWKNLIPKITISSEAAQRIKTSYSYYKRMHLRNKISTWFTRK